MYCVNKSTIINHFIHKRSIHKSRENLTFSLVRTVFLSSSVPHRESRTNNRQQDPMGLRTGSPYCPVTYWRWEDQEIAFGPQSTTVAPVQPCLFRQVYEELSRQKQNRFLRRLIGHLTRRITKDWLDRQTIKLISPHIDIYMYKNNILRW